MNREELISIRLKLLMKELPSHRNVDLIAVSKKYPAEDIQLALNSSHYDFGENRVDELEEKSSHFLHHDRKPLWHFIGNLQGNKVKKLLEIQGLNSIHSIDSFSLLENIIKNKNLIRSDIPINLFLQIKTSDEKEKSGFDNSDDLMKAANLLAKHDGDRVRFAGLMTMGKIRTDNFEADARKCFKKLRKKRDRLITDFGFENLRLSMGMSQDYHIAIEEGSDVIRVGSKIFAPENS